MEKNKMERQRLINLDRITCINVATVGSNVFLVFQDGRKNYGYRVTSVEHAQGLLKAIEREKPKWWRVLGNPIEMSFKKQDE